MSGGSESDDCVTANERVYIPEVKNKETPAVEMKFDSLDLVYNFYNRYAFLAGFGIRLHSSFWGKNKKEILRKNLYVAYRRDETRERKRQRGISRCNCKAKIMVVKTNGSKNYTISLFAEGHNHKMTPSERMHLLRSHHHISDSTKVLTKHLGSVNILIHQKGVRVLWRCCCIHTTFNTNRYDLTFAPMLGVNNHGQTIVLACAFLSKEKTELFIWMFEEFKKAMPGGKPKTIITDQDAAMTERFQ
ncbi:Homeodomain-like superfamily protein [Prunus dulcis]|uniref:Homeodomain-like superfamily protein n=1 Tax=Prunus dulcis TaxID=3755 RepID=A0A5H2YAB0_PRUDU|nr:Homeodomain-like superfamily protein [Prunus dulcis]